MEIRQGDIFWIEARQPVGSAPGFTRPFVVVQNNLFNRGKINTVLVCALTTNLSYEYEFDNQGNWIKKSDFAWAEKEGKSDWKLMNVVYRKIEYLDTK